MNAPDSLSSASATFAPARITPNTAHAFGGIWRLTLRRHFTLGHWAILAGAVVLLVLFSYAAAPMRVGKAPDFLPWLSRFYLCFLVPVLTFIVAAGVMRDDLQADAVDYIFTRPVRRPLYVAFRYVAHMVCAQLDFLLVLAFLCGVAVYRGVPDLPAALPRLVLAQVLVVLAFGAFGFLCGMLTSRYVIVGLLYGGVIEFGVGAVPTQLSRLSMVRQVFGLLRPVVGGDEAVGSIVLVSKLSMPATVGLLLLFAAVMLAATAALFSVKELAGGSGREA